MPFTAFVTTSGSMNKHISVVFCVQYTGNRNIEAWPGKKGGFSQSMLHVFGHQFWFSFAAKAEIEQQRYLGF